MNAYLENMLSSCEEPSQLQNKKPLLIIEWWFSSFKNLILVSVHFLHNYWINRLRSKKMKKLDEEMPKRQTSPSNIGKPNFGSCREESNCIKKMALILESHTYQLFWLFAGKDPINRNRIISILKLVIVSFASLLAV